MSQRFDIVVLTDGNGDVDAPVYQLVASGFFSQPVFTVNSAVSDC